VTDLGTDVPAEEFVQALKAAIADRGAKLVGASALLTTTMSEQQKIIKTIEEAGLRDEVKIMVGGAPVTQSWAEKIGADGFAKDAISAVGLAKRLVGAG
jgi:5-methyltetrahydrofolate--homocysteine methyltransferase